MTSSTQEGQLHMHVTHIYFIRRFMNLCVGYPWGTVRQHSQFISVTLKVVGRCLKNFVSFEFIIQDHRLTVVDETVLKEQD